MKMEDVVAQLRGRAKVAEEAEEQNRSFVFEHDLRKQETKFAQFDMYEQAGKAVAYYEAAALIEMTLRDAD